jgi:solute carrier family 15 (peptide/histidine transporter), member 3/4
MLINTMAFIWVAAGYEYKSVEHVSRTAPRVLAPPTVRRPPRPPPSAPMASIATSRAHPGAAAPTVVASQESPIPSMYGRSVTFMPQTPAMPAPFR